MTDLMRGVYEPSPSEWVRDQVDLYESTGGAEGATLPGTDQSIVVITSVGAISGKLRKNPVMRVEKDGVYLAVASKGGAPGDPTWAANFVADPVVQLQDGPEPALYRSRLVTDQSEYAEWWERAVAAFPNYAEYAKKTEGIRQIPLFLLERVNLVS